MSTTLNMKRGQTMTKYKTVRKEFGTISYTPLFRPNPYDTHRDKKDPFDEYMKAQMKSSTPKINTEPKNISIDDKKTSTEKVIESISGPTPDKSKSTEHKTSPDPKDTDMLFLLGEEKEEVKEAKEAKETEETKDDHSQKGGSSPSKRIVLQGLDMLRPDKKKHGGEFLI